MSSRFSLIIAAQQPRAVLVERRGHGPYAAWLYYFVFGVQRRRLQGIVRKT